MIIFPAAYISIQRTMNNDVRMGVHENLQKKKIFVLLIANSLIGGAASFFLYIAEISRKVDSKNVVLIVRLTKCTNITFLHSNVTTLKKHYRQRAAEFQPTFKPSVDKRLKIRLEPDNFRLALWPFHILLN